MVSLIVFFHITILLSFNIVQGLIQISPKYMIEIFRQAGNDSKFKEFVDIYNHFINLTVSEKNFRDTLDNITSTNSTGDDEKQIYPPLMWRSAVKEALDELVFNTTELDETLTDVLDYINNFTRSPEVLKEIFLQQHLAEDNTTKNGSVEVLDTDLSSDEFLEGENATQVNEVWVPDNNKTRRIYRGQKTKIRKFPFMATIQVFDRFQCAGSIISEDLVITAASCLQLAWNNRFYRENPSFLSVRVGSHFFTIGGEVIPVLEVYFHPSYIPKTLKNNLAIMRLLRIVNFKRKNVKRIRIDQNPSPLPVDTPGITIIGWGAKTAANKIYNVAMNRIHQTVLDFYDLRTCREVYGKEYVTRTNFCAGFITKGEGACNQDVGDPGVSDGQLMGVTSFGSPVCGRPDTPTVFTKLGFYAKWIHDIMDQNVPRIKVRTTTQRPFDMIGKTHPLLGLNSEENKKIVPFLRELQGILPDQEIKTTLKDTNDINIQPMLDSDSSSQDDLEPYIKLLERFVDRASEEDFSANSQEGKDMSEQVGVDVPTINREIQVVRMPDHLSAASNKEDENGDGSVKYEFPINSHETDFEGFLRDVTVRPSTAISNFDPDEYVEKESNFDENTAELRKKESSIKRLKKHRVPVKGSNTANSIPKDLPLRKNKKKKVKKSKRNKSNHAITTDTDPTDILIEFGVMKEKHDDDLKEKKQKENIGRDLKYETRIEDKQVADKMQETLTDEIIKREIKKLIKQLEETSGMAISEDQVHKIISNVHASDKKGKHRKRKLAHGESKSGKYYKKSDRTEVQFRAEENKSEDNYEGLNIEPTPFQVNNENIYDSIGNGGIYEIFNEVLASLSNKSSIFY